uniref:Uncharacterized protein n=1 Tax=Caenorhabditis tropicalis TaxID=1561998 RepID=A0A1I7UGE0_9PELO
MSNSKPLCDKDHSQDGLYREIENIEKVINLDENKRKNIVNLKEEIKSATQNPDNLKCPFIAEKMATSDDQEMEKLRMNVIDQISAMGKDQLEQVHVWLKCNDIENIERKNK